VTAERTRLISRPAVTVLLPVRDAEDTLEASLASIAAQTLDDHEVVAVDDGSRDRSAALLEAAARRDPRLRVLRTGGRGLVAALNLGLAEARAELIARMDADDVARPRRLERQMERLREEPTTSIVGCRVALETPEGQANRGMKDYVSWLNRLLDHESIVRDLWVESPLPHPSVTVRASTLRALGGYREFDGPEDYDLWLRARAMGLRFGKVPEELLVWRDSLKRLSRRDRRYSSERFRALKIETLEAGLLAGGRPIVIWGAGPGGKSWARDLLARGREVAAFVEVDPRKLDQRIHGIPVVPVDAAGRFPGALHLAAVAGPSARERIRDEAGRMGLQDGRDLIAVA
jgi:glycosyltransferase involved in cell wall biosynthesis